MYIYVLESFFIPIEIPPVENLTVVDQCITIRASWDINEGSCTNLSYDVTLSLSNGTKIQALCTTNDSVYAFDDTETISGTFNVTVVPINRNIRGASVTRNTSVIDISPG